MPVWPRVLSACSLSLLPPPHHVQKSFVASLAVASAAPFIPTIPMCAPKTQWNPQQNCYPMPIVGEGSCCGTYNITSWLNAGGIHIDTSTDYGSQPDIGNAIRASGIPRANLWLTSKLNVESWCVRVAFSHAARTSL